MAERGWYTPYAYFVGQRDLKGTSMSNDVRNGAGYVAPTITDLGSHQSFVQSVFRGGAFDGSTQQGQGTTIFVSASP